MQGVNMGPEIWIKCIHCKKPYDLRKEVRKTEVGRSVLCPKCGRVVTQGS
jgi:DNA-directed RNA polymerase subunit RPC12/RpoP